MNVKPASVVPVTLGAVTLVCSRKRPEECADTQLAHRASAITTTARQSILLIDKRSREE